MEWDENKITVLNNVQILLNNMGESHNWLNKKIFGSNAKDKPKNDLWRTDQKTLPSKRAGQRFDPAHLHQINSIT